MRLNDTDAEPQKRHLWQTFAWAYRGPSSIQHLHAIEVQIEPEIRIGSAKPLFAGSIPARASNITLMDSVTYGQPSTDECASVIIARPLVIMATWHTVATECTPPVCLREV